MQDTYIGDDKEDKYIPLHYEAIENKKPFFASRSVRYESDLVDAKYLLTTVLFVPCSTDQKTINYAIGIVLFEYGPDMGEVTYNIVGD